MSRYTTEIKDICESLSGISSGTFADIDEIIGKSIDKIFNFDYPIFDINYKSVLEKKILLHYYTREIGLETYGLWKLKLKTKLNEIMPYYNQLYKSELLEFNPFYEVDLTKDYTNKKNGNSEADLNSKTDKNSKADTLTDSHSKSVDMYSDTPQGAINEDFLFISADGSTYLTNARKVNGDNLSSQNGIFNEETEKKDLTKNKFDNTEEYLEHVKGKVGRSSASSLLMEYRKTFINIDLMIIDELNDLFMNIW